MRRPRVVWAVGCAVLVLAIASAVQVALVLPFGYDFRAYWLAARDLWAGERLYPAVDARLGLPGEFHYLPIVAMPFLVFASLPFEMARALWLGIEVAVAIALGLALVRPLPNDARPWAAAAYVFFLPTVLEVTLGNLDLVSVALVLLAWHWRTRATRAALPFAIGVGLKFLPAILIPFYLLAGHWHVVARAALAGAVMVAVTLPVLWRATLDYIELFPRYAETDWVRIIVERDEPAFLSAIFWSAEFPLVLTFSALAAALFCGAMARRDVRRETDWHHIALALAPYLAPFGFVWTTFLIASLPLFARTLARALALRGVVRVAAVTGIGSCWLAMQIVQVRDLYPLLAHLVGVLGLVAIALLLLALETRQTLGRSTPRSRATSIASG